MNVSKRNNNGIHTLPESVEIKKSKSINRSQQQCDKKQNIYITIKKTWRETNFQKWIIFSWNVIKEKKVEEEKKKEVNREGINIGKILTVYWR